MNQENFFPVNRELVKALEDRFPMRDFDINAQLRELDYHAGQRSVVNFLRDRLDQQIENSLTSIQE